MLCHKLKQIEDGLTFVGRTTKQARSQGKKIQITAEQEISRFFFLHSCSFIIIFLLVYGPCTSLFDFECLSNNAGYWGTWPGHTCKKETIKLLKNIIGELLRWNQNGVYVFYFCFLEEKSNSSLFVSTGKHCPLRLIGTNSAIWLYV